MTSGNQLGPLARFLQRASRSFDYRVGRLQSRILCEVKERRLRLRDRQREQSASYMKLGLNRDVGIEAINGALSDAGLGVFSEDDDMFSEHLVLLGALSRNAGELKEVLEIGTYDGRTALILSHLFPSASVTTIDLPPNDPIYGASYEVARSNEFVNRRNEYLGRNKRVKFVEMNSLDLTRKSETDTYDLIWVDGDHDFPTVGIDLANAVRLLRPGGYLLCDDVVTAKPSRSTTYLSDAAHRTLTALWQAALIEQPTYVYKRLGKRHQHPRKFVALTTTRARSRAT